MSDFQEPVSPPAPVAPPRRTCISRLGGAVVWLLSLALTVALALVAAGATAYYLFGYSWDTPAQIAQSRRDLEALRQENGVLQTQVALAQTETAQQAGRTGAQGEQLDELRGDLEAMQREAAELAALSNTLRENVAQAATIQAEARESRATVAAFATVQANSAAQIADLERRTERISRFLQRLGDIASDTAFDLGNGATPTPLALTPPAVSTPTPEPTPTAAPELSPTPTPVP